MNAIQRSLRRGRLRVVANDALHWLAIFLVLAIAIASADVLTRGLAGVCLGWPLYLGLTLAAPLLAAGLGWWRRPDDRHVAQLLDHRLNLKDRLGTALYAQSRRDDPFAGQVVQEALDASSRLAVAKALPLRLTRAWRFVPVAAAFLALVIGIVWADAFGLDQSRRHRAQQLAAQQEQQDQAREQIVKVLAEVKQIPRTSDVQAQPLAEQSLRQLAELAQQDLSSPQLQQQAAAKLSEIEQTLDEQVKEQSQPLQSLQSMLSQLDPQTPGPADAFAQALRRGDFAAAAQQLQQLAQNIESMPADQRQALQQQLQNLAGQLGQAAQQQQQQLQQAMQNAGVSPQQAQQLAQQMQQQQQNMTPQQMQQALQQSGMNQQQAQQLSQQLSQMQQRSGSQPTQQLSQSMQRLAQPNQSPQGFKQCSGGACNQLQQLAQMQQQVQQLRQAQGQAQQGLQQLGGGNGNQTNPFQGQSPSQGNRPGGHKAGTGEGGDPMGTHRQMANVNSTAVGQADNSDGRMIASWLTGGDNERGTPTVEFTQSIQEARQAAEHALNDDRVPRRYESTIRDYFNQLPQSPDQIAAPSPPPAPR